jgi:hypothetical protein
MKSSAGPSRAGSGRPAAAPAGIFGLLERLHAGAFPSTLYVEGPSEPLKAALLGQLVRAEQRAALVGREDLLDAGLGGAQDARQG